MLKVEKIYIDEVNFENKNKCLKTPNIPGFVKVLGWFNDNGGIKKQKENIEKSKQDYYDPTNILLRIGAKLAFEPNTTLEDLIKTAFIHPIDQEKMRKLEEIKKEVIPTDSQHLKIYKRICKDLKSVLEDEFEEINFTDIYFRATADYWRYRDKYVNTFSWSIPNLEALLEIAKLEKIIEIYSGTGYWSSLLFELGCNITCYDNFTWRPYKEENKFGLHYPINNINECDLSDFEGCNLMISWPPYGDDECINYLKIIKPEKLIYIGESKHGCCGNDSFFEEIEKKYREIVSIKLPQWQGIHDWMIIYERKPNLYLIKG